MALRFPEAALHLWQPRKSEPTLPPAPGTVSKVSYVSELSSFSVWMSILITLAPVLGKRMIALPSAVSP